MKLSRHLARPGKLKAVIIKGNPKYLNDSKINTLAHAFYEEIKTLVASQGFEVSFDAGEPMTMPDKSAAVWIAHSRGIDRLQWAPASVKTIALETEEDKDLYLKTDQSTNDRRGNDPLHYRLSKDDRSKLTKLQ